MRERRYRVVLHRVAVSEIAALPDQARERVKQAIDGLAEDPRPAGCSKLQGRPNAYRLRFGDYRLVYEVHATEVVVYVFGVANRRQVYVRLLRRRR
jgi:mRNA interferase RelE/StbE